MKSGSAAIVISSDLSVDDMVMEWPRPNGSG